MKTAAPSFPHGTPTAIRLAAWFESLPICALPNDVPPCSEGHEGGISRQFGLPVLQGTHVIGGMTLASTGTSMRAHLLLLMGGQRTHPGQSLSFASQASKSGGASSASKPGSPSPSSASSQPG